MYTHLSMLHASIRTLYIFGKIMKKQINSGAKDQLSLAFDEEAESPFLEWLMGNGKMIAYLIAGLFAVLTFLYLWSSNTTARAEIHYRSAQESFQKFQNLSLQKGNEKEDSASILNELTLLLKKYPDLQAKYDGAIAQSLIYRDQLAEAMPFAEATFSRVSQDHLPDYLQYSQISLLVSQKKYEEALRDSLSLKEKMLNELKNNKEDVFFGSYLFALNLLRIPFLQQYAGTSQQEIDAWREWELYANKTKAIDSNLSLDKKAFFSVGQMYSIGIVSLEQYIAQRIKHLEKKDVNGVSS